MSRRHPSDARLAAWLEHGQPASVGRHVEGCDDCLARAEAASDLHPDTRAGLSSATSPDTDLRARTTAGVRDHLDDEEALSVLADLFGLAWGVTRAVLDRSPLGDVLDRSPRSDADPGQDDPRPTHHDG
ncbi:MAG TPA: hypothetical protein VK866_10635 [Acidimicrobiales bacterium]|nr:hypothetical protein [Acidimicrobiales bacterium]